MVTIKTASCCSINSFAATSNLVFLILKYRRFNIKRYNKQRMWIVSLLISPLVQTLHETGRKKSALRHTKVASPRAGIRLIFRFWIQPSPIWHPETPTGKMSKQKQIVVLSARALATNSCPLGSRTVRSKMKNRKKEKEEETKEKQIYNFVLSLSPTCFFLISRNEES